MAGARWDPTVFLTAPSLDDASVAHGFFTRRGGVSEGIYGSLNCGFGSGDERDRVAENRSRVLAALEPAEGLVTLYQVHSPTVVTVEDPWAPEAAPRADAMVSNRSGIALGILTADCAPLLLADADAGVVGAAHAGWRGAVGGVVAATVRAMTALGAATDRIVAAVGPAIGPDSYEVGADLHDQFVKKAPANEGYFRPAGDRWLFDLPRYAARELERAGVGAPVVVGRDTCREYDSFFSYRRSCKRGEPDYGRQLSVIVLA